MLSICASTVARHVDRNELDGVARVVEEHVGVTGCDMGSHRCHEKRAGLEMEDAGEGGAAHRVQGAGMRQLVIKHFV